MQVSVVSESGHPDGRNEDWACGTTRIAIILDGLSEGPETGCIHGTPWFVRQLGSRLLGLAEDSDRSLSESLGEAITQVADSHRSTCDLNHPGSPCTTVAILRDKGATFDYLVLSDSTVVIDSTAGLTVITDNSVGQVARKEVKAAHAVPVDDPNHMSYHLALITAQQYVRNKPGGYWVAQSDPEASRYAKTGAVDAADFQAGIVLSDGAARIVTDFQQWDWRTLIDFTYSNSVLDLIAHTRQLEQTDASGVRWKRYKISDDASAILCIPGLGSNSSP